MPTKWLQNRTNGSKTAPGIPPHRAFCGVGGMRHTADYKGREYIYIFIYINVFIYIYIYIYIDNKKMYIYTHAHTRTM